MIFNAVFWGKRADGTILPNLLHSEFEAESFSIALVEANSRISKFFEELSLAKFKTYWADLSDLFLGSLAIDYHKTTAKDGIDSFKNL